MPGYYDIDDILMEEEVAEGAYILSSFLAWCWCRLV
jgi:hypothetical protein